MASLPDTVRPIAPLRRSVNLDPFLAPIGVTIFILALPFVFGLGRPGGMELSNFRFFLTGSQDPNAPLTLAVFQFIGYGVVWTVSVALVSILLSLPLATLFALGRLSSQPVIKWASTTYIEVIRALPVLLLIIFIFFQMRTAPAPFLPRDALAVGLALTIYTAAVNAEIIRSGIQSLPRGQFEASQALGMNYFQMIWYVILPQTFRRVLPPLIAQFTTLLKDTSLGSIIGTVELAQRGRIIFQQGRNPLETYYLIAIIYFILNYILGRISVSLQRRR
jgi:His/Glu/Gln/Arg/opine family amino acid ABC transporter permease subunit